MTTSNLTSEEVTSIAHLARLQLTADEINQAAGNLNDVLNHFSQIQHIDTDGIPAADDASGLKNVTRPDVARATDLAEPAAVLATVPRVSQDHQVRVPHVL